MNHGPEGQDHGGQSPGDHDLDGQGLNSHGLDGLLSALGQSPASGEGSRSQGVKQGFKAGQGFDELGSDELALRRLLHQAVDEIEPTDGTLEHLRRAVPARRARKRQAVVGMAAAALFIGTAIPALVHVSNATGSDADPSIAGNSSQTQGGSSQGKETDGGSRASGGSSSTSKGTDKGKDGKKDRDKDKGPGTATGGASAGPSASVAVASECTATQLGAGATSVGTPDSTGAIYGSLPISNISTTACTVTGAGGVSTAVAGAADASKVSVVNHVAGDAAVGLPDPATEVAQLLLQPGTSYVVKFAWVPSETCPTTGGSTGSTDPSPDPTPTEGSTDTGGTTTTTDGTTGTSAQLVREDGVADGSVTVSLTAPVGSPMASATVSNACAGTVYRTGMLAS
ncbi:MULTISPECIES: hypothetical protein [unclassified Streptomyces]|uniref:hypothetical protein n=1 Tax=unclassified Streptomyces TaxID=2593676 RepID=UPI0033B4EEBC